jgi:hypothetical protein
MLDRGVDYKSQMSQLLVAFLLCLHCFLSINSKRLEDRSMFSAGFSLFYKNVCGNGHGLRRRALLSKTTSLTRCPELVSVPFKFHQ